MTQFPLQPAVTPEALDETLCKKAEGDAALSYALHHQDLMQRTKQFWAGYAVSLVSVEFNACRESFTDWQYEHYFDCFIAVWDGLAAAEKPVVVERITS